MAKVEVQKLKAEERDRLRRQFGALLSVASTEGYTLEFALSFFTPSELIMFGRRIDIALELLKGTSGEDIRRKYGVAYTTISLVDSFLRNALSDYRSTIPSLLKRPPQVLKRGIARLKKRAPVIGALLELLHQSR